MSRRKVLAGIGLAGTGAAGAYIGRQRKPEDSDEDGLSDREEDGNLDAYLESVYDDEVGLDVYKRDLIIDARYVEGESFPDEHKDKIVDLFGDNGIDVLWLDYPETYDRDEYLKRYGHVAENVLGGWWRPIIGMLHALDPRKKKDVDRKGMFGQSPTLYEEWVEDDLKDVALQLFFVPGKPTDEYGANRLYSELANLYHVPDKYSAGVSYINRAMVADNDSYSKKLTTTTHEIAHIGACHHYHDESNAGLMGQYDEHNFTEKEWAEIRDGLQNIQRSEIGLLLNACWSHLTESK